MKIFLKQLYSIFESKEHLRTFRSAELTEARSFNTGSLNQSLKRLVKKGFLEKNMDQFSLTDSGIIESKRIARLASLWEQYLLKRTRVDVDHVHSGAEAIEHIITPEIEKELEKELGIEGIPQEDY